MTTWKTGMAGFVIDAFDAVTADLEDICADAESYTHQSWIDRQTAVASSVGAAAMTMPGAHMIAMAADTGVLMSRMAVTSYGIGAIHVRSSAVPIEREDFALVLAIWAGDVTRGTLSMAWTGATAKARFKLGVRMGEKGSFRMAHTLGNALGILAGKQLSAKTATKIGAKLGIKYAVRGAAGWLPVVGALIGAGLNSYFVRDIADSALQYFQSKTDGIARALRTDEAVHA